MQSPTAIDDGETVWLRSRDVSDSPAIGGDAYFDTHDVPGADEMTRDDIPPTEDDAVREIDRDALDQSKLIGKWQVTGSADSIEELWPNLLDDAVEGTIWAVKAMTQTGYQELPYDDYMLVVYTPNYFDQDDVFRVRDHLREAHGVTHEIYYKPDIYTAKGIVAETAAEFGLSKPARYVA